MTIRLASGRALHVKSDLSSVHRSVIPTGQLRLFPLMKYALRCATLALTFVLVPHRTSVRCSSRIARCSFIRVQ